MEKLIRYLEQLILGIEQATKKAEPAPAPAPVPAPVATPAPEPQKEPVKPIPPSKRELLYAAAYASLGVDMAPTQDALGCAEAISFVMMKAGVKGLPKRGILGTPELGAWLAKHMISIRGSEAREGDIAIAMTGDGNGKVRGHVWVVGKNTWMSNNSKTGKWDHHWTAKGALDYYTKYGGIPMRFYRWG